MKEKKIYLTNDISSSVSSESVGSSKWFKHMSNNKQR